MCPACGTVHTHPSAGCRHCGREIPDEEADPIFATANQRMQSGRTWWLPRDSVQAEAANQAAGFAQSVTFTRTTRRNIGTDGQEEMADADSADCGASPTGTCASPSAFRPMHQSGAGHGVQGSETRTILPKGLAMKKRVTEDAKKPKVPKLRCSFVVNEKPLDDEILWTENTSLAGFGTYTVHHPKPRQRLLTDGAVPPDLKDERAPRGRVKHEYVSCEFPIVFGR